MLSDLKSLRNEHGSVLVTALLVMAVMIPIGFALLAIVDTQAPVPRRTRHRRRRGSSPCAAARWTAA